jgi:hypothetical protein
LWSRPATPGGSLGWSEGDGGDPAEEGADSTAARLEQVFRELTAELERWKPDAVAIEEVFYSVNAKSALKLGQVRGVALLAAAMQGLPVAEYAPLKIKSSVVGYGLAKKEQVQFMVARLLELAEFRSRRTRRMRWRLRSATFIRRRRWAARGWAMKAAWLALVLLRWRCRCGPGWRRG